MYCRNCGKEVTKESEYCMNCGAGPMACNGIVILAGKFKNKSGLLISDW